MNSNLHFLSVGSLFPRTFLARFNGKYRTNMNPKFDFYLEPQVESNIISGQFKARRHPGVMQVKPQTLLRLPLPFFEAAEVVLADYEDTTLEEDAKKLKLYIWSRHLPIEKTELKMKGEILEEKVISKETIDPMSPLISEEQRVKMLRVRQHRLWIQLKKNMYHWMPIEFDKYKCAQYLMARAAPDFASLMKIFAEINKRDPKFTPMTFFDFGSGIGTGLWALNSTWPNHCQEAMCVDASSEMIDMAERLLQGSSQQNDVTDIDNVTAVPFVKGLFFKQFLPTSEALKYDIVLSSRSLFELPDMATRLRTLDILWRKTSQYLVLVEAGTNAGYQLVLEARDFVIELSRRSESESSHVEGFGTVFAPCPHDLACPRLLDGSKTPCNFPVSYRPLDLTERDPQPQLEMFSYVVIRRSYPDHVRETADQLWPRIVRPVLKKSHHVICRTCTRCGDLREFTSTKAKHSKSTCQVSKQCEWGDLFPIRHKEIEAADASGTAGVDEGDKLTVECDREDLTAVKSDVQS